MKAGRSRPPASASRLNPPNPHRHRVVPSLPNPLKGVPVPSTSRFAVRKSASVFVRSSTNRGARRRVGSIPDTTAPAIGSPALSLYGRSLNAEIPARLAAHAVTALRPTGHTIAVALMNMTTHYFAFCDRRACTRSARDANRRLPAPCFAPSFESLPLSGRPSHSHLGDFAESSAAMPTTPAKQA